MKTEFFLTKVAKDWHESNLSTIRDALRDAEAATRSRSDKVADPLLDTPNHPNIRGYLRWVLVQRCLELAVKGGRFNGITAKWNNRGGVSVLELHGQHTVVTPAHLSTSDESPRESIYRRDCRIENEVCPLLTGWGLPEESAPEISPLRLLLVHGCGDEEFAYLRAYTDPDNRAVYRTLSNNIMLLHAPVLFSTLDTESVMEPQIGLKEAVTVRTASAE